MVVLIAFAAGVITAISPCVLPVLPIVLAGGASGSRRRPYAIVVGMLLSFVVSILLATWILDQLGLPKDLLRNISIGLLFLVAATLLIPQLGLWIERPLSRLARGQKSDLGGGFVLGVALGFVFVPCGGPVLAFVSSQAASLQLSAKTVLVAIAYALGAAVVLLGIAMGGRRVSSRFRSPRVRVALGTLMALAAFGLVFNLDTRLQKWLPDYTNFLQKHTEASAYARSRLATHKNVTQRQPAQATSAAGLPDFGPAPDFRFVDAWINSKPLTIKSLRGKVVLVDFWTYSCINCLRTLPYLKAWYSTYAKDGLVIVGVHTPEFTFEHDLGNVKSATKDLGVRYPVAIDNGYGTWNAYGNQYWPAEYLIDRNGHIRHSHFGEGQYTETETAIRKLLGEKTKLPKELAIPDHTPTGVATPETYFGYGRIADYFGSELHNDRMASYTFPKSLPQNGIAYGGEWEVRGERIIAGKNAAIRLNFQAQRVHMVVGGKPGRLDVLLNGKQVASIRVTKPQLYTLVSLPAPEQAQLEVRVTPGVAAYTFTFG